MGGFLTVGRPFTFGQWADASLQYVGPATQSARNLIDSEEQPFDLVFIDADKPNNPNYLEAALNLTTRGAVIIVDNVVRDGAVTQSGSSRRSRASGPPRRLKW